MKKLFLCTFLVFVIVSGFALVGMVQVSAQAHGEVVVISSDTVWTNVAGLRELAGDVIVSEGVTLTVDAGVTVNLNYYKILVNGTLAARGKITDPVHFVDGRIEFTEFSVGWDEQTGTGSIFENVVLENVYLFNSDRLRISNTADADIVWTKADSPHILTGPFSIDDGVTLTIEEGATVNLNGYDILVDGTLRILGSSIEKIYIENGGKIEFSSSSNGWNEQTSSGSIINYATLDNVDVISNVSLKICDNKIINSRIEGELIFLNNDASSSNIVPKVLTLVSGNTVNGLNIWGSPTVTNNSIYYVNVYSGSATISCNTLNKIFINGGSPSIIKNSIVTIGGSGGSPVISENTINEIGSYKPFPKEETKYFTVESATITNNIIERGILLSCTSAIVSNNTIYAYTHAYTRTVYVGDPEWSWMERLGMDESEYLEEVIDYATTSGIIFRGSGYVSGNIISGCAIGIECGTAVVEGNLLINNTEGIVITERDVVVRSNNITNGVTGINGVGNEAIIENNYIGNQNTTGISLRISGVTIRNNTICNTLTAIELYRCSSSNIHYNNIENNQNNIILDETSDNIDATYNWWGTTDIQTIDATIHDLKDDSNLGTVVLNPMLTEPNNEVMPTKIPEFPSWIFLSLFLAATFVVVVIRKKTMWRNGKL